MGRRQISQDEVGPPINPRAGLRREQAGREADEHLQGTLEDAYYDNHGHNNSPGVQGCGVIPKDMHGAHDSLGLAV
ncbi:hypothetical protein Bca52824_028441 [Brassica carinata]|uniref:Uncharacterized protein n=1 Tax=Brassica carinata TaxID=52824 RepID=A0A8X8AQ04_BRACI|nr:hypothetical protein Bca52824_028441 [Brassica carinata]